MTIELIVKPGEDATPEERAAFEELVRRAPQVDPIGLSGRIVGAHVLAFLYKDSELIGTGAIKNNPGYQASVAADAGVPLPTAKYLGEVGYIHTAEGHRRQGHADQVLAKLIEAPAKGVVRPQPAAAQARCGEARSRRFAPVRA